jgi:L,D-transpeptidase ErfK/SrfK
MYKASIFPITLLFGLLILAGSLQQSAVGAEILFSQGVGGAIGYRTTTTADSLIELAALNDVGYNEIIAANPGIDPFAPEEGLMVTIPGRWILPDVPRRSGIVINLAEMRLYHFHARSRGLVDTFPIGIGDQGWGTPIGTYRIIEKIANTAWSVPASIRAEKPELPAIVPPGPDNPLGAYALRLSIGSLLIHGTNHPYGIGRRVSHGCIHLYPKDIKKLFREVKLGTVVTIVWQPAKVTVADGRVWVEIHGQESAEVYQEAFELMQRRGLAAKVNLAALNLAVAANSGLPTDVTKE